MLQDKVLSDHITGRTTNENKFSRRQYQKQQTKTTKILKYKYRTNGMEINITIEKMNWRTLIPVVKMKNWIVK